MHLSQGHKPSSPKKLTEELLKRALKKSGNSKVNLSKCLEVRLSTVCLWYKDIQPNEKNLQKIEQFLSDEGGVPQ